MVDQRKLWTGYTLVRMDGKRRGETEKCMSWTATCSSPARIKQERGQVSLSPWPSVHAPVGSERGAILLAFPFRSSAVSAAFEGQVALVGVWRHSAPSSHLASMPSEPQVLKKIEGKDDLEECERGLRRSVERPKDRASDDISSNRRMAPGSWLSLGVM